jgi:FHA domain-containing protein/zinc ribbon family protein
MTVLLEGSSQPPDIHESGERITEVTPGSLYCVECGYALSVAAIDALPECPNCAGSRFRRASLFAQPTMDSEAVEAPKSPPSWLQRVRANLRTPGHYLAFENDDNELCAQRIGLGWTRIGRSGTADVRFDDATVSRRHALIVLTEQGELRALDDRSLNGLFVNGERVDWSPLRDGDELEIGRYRLYVLTA